ncbi:ankyrin repeat domain-containing protein [Verrucomicrobiota bacterium sgz303538]
MPFTADGFVRTVSTGHQPLIDLFLSAGMDINSPASDGRTALLTVALAKNWPLMDRFLQLGASPNTADEHGLTPLMAVAMVNQTDSIQTLLSHGALLDAKDEHGHTALHYAVATRSLGSIQTLIAAGANCTDPCCEGQTLYSHAVETKDWRIVEPILTRQPSTLDWNSYTQQELTSAIKARNAAKAKLLLSKHPAAPTPEGHPQPLLAHALLSNDLTTFKFLLDCGADPNTPLGSPVQKDFGAQVKENFLRHYLSTEPGMTVLMMAAGMSRIDFVQELLNKGAKRGIGTKNYKMPALLFATRNENPDVIQMLIDKAPKPEDLRIEISLGSQRASVIKNGIPVFSTSVSTGKSGYSTPTGRFVVTDKHRDHTSTLYKAQMPFFMRLNARDFGMHAGVVPGYPASHGCIRVPSGNAQKLFREIPIGTLVSISY